MSARQLGTRKGCTEGRPKQLPRDRPMGALVGAGVVGVGAGPDRVGSGAGVGGPLQPLVLSTCS